MKHVRLSVAVLALALLHVARAAAATNVACVGDSITYGYGLNANESYPSDLQGLLGSTYVVKNFGQNGATMLKNGDNSYWKLALFTQSDAFAPNVVVIMLGTNDSKPDNWAHESEFEGDYTAMVQHYRDLGARVYVAIPPPAANNPQYWQIEKVIPHIRKVAAAMAAPVIDVHAAFTGTPQYFADDVHPNAAGARVLANTVFAGITQPADGGMSLDGATGFDAAMGAGGKGGASGAGGSKGGAAGAGRADAGNSAAGSAIAGGGQGGSAGATGSSTGGASAMGSGGNPNPVGAGGDESADVEGDGSGDSGCSCRTTSGSSRQGAWLGLLGLAAIRVRGRHRRRPSFEPRGT